MNHHATALCEDGQLML